MDVESAPKPPEPHKPAKRSHICRNACIAVLVVIILIVLLLVILAFTVFKAKHPITTVNSTKLRNLAVSLSMAPLGVNLNVTLDVGISVKNPNRVGFKYKNSTAQLDYRGELVGEVPIPADEISAEQTKSMNLTLTVLANKFLSNSQAYSDILSGALPLSTYTRMSGKVKILSVLKVHLVSTTTCAFDVYISNRTVGNQVCQYKTKL